MLGVDLETTSVLFEGPRARRIRRVAYLDSHHARHAIMLPGIQKINRTVSVYLDGLKRPRKMFPCTQFLAGIEGIEGGIQMFETTTS